MKQKQREIFAKAQIYAHEIGRHNPNINTPYWKYRDALKHISEILLANFSAHDNDNPHQREDQDAITDGFVELEKLLKELKSE